MFSKSRPVDLYRDKLVNTFQNNDISVPGTLLSLTRKGGHHLHVLGTAHNYFTCILYCILDETE